RVANVEAAQGIAASQIHAVACRRCDCRRSSGAGRKSVVSRRAIGISSEDGVESYRRSGQRLIVLQIDAVGLRVCAASRAQHDVVTGLRIWCRSAVDGVEGGEGLERLGKGAAIK